MLKRVEHVFRRTLLAETFRGEQLQGVHHGIDGCISKQARGT
jgi:hypothetical protein